MDDTPIRTAFQLRTLLVALPFLQPAHSFPQTHVRPVQQIAQAVDSVLSKAAEQGFSGDFLLMHGDTIILHKGYGWSDRDRARPMRPDLVYDIGSITKGVTATAILQLAEQGRIALDSPVATYLDDWPKNKQQVTIGHLLGHASGLPESFGMDEDTAATRASFMEQVRDSSLLFPPGDGFHYSNVGYTVLGYVLEAVTGLGYEAFLQRSLFAPLGIERMGYQLPQWDPQEVVCGQLDGRPWGSTRDHFGRTGPSPYLLANGGMLASATDLAAFFRALINGHLLSAESTTFFIDHVSRAMPSGDRCFHLSGANMIFSSVYAQWLENKVSYVLFTNDSAHPKEQVEPAIEALIDAQLARSAPRK